MYDCYTSHSKETNQHQIQTGLGHTPRKEKEEKSYAQCFITEVNLSFTLGFLKHSK